LSNKIEENTAKSLASKKPSELIVMVTFLRPTLKWLAAGYGVVDITEFKKTYCPSYIKGFTSGDRVGMPPKILKTVFKSNLIT
jgi:hypothetical protein